MKYVKSVLISLVVANGIVVVLAVNPDHRRLVFREDGLVESVTALLFLCTFLLAAMLLFSRRIENKSYRRWLMLFSIVGLLGFLDELSFGERMFDLDFPIVNGIKLDAVHDLVELTTTALGDRLETYVLLFVPFLVLASAIVVFGFLARKRSLKMREVAGSDTDFPLYVIVLAMVLMGVSAIILDAKILPSIRYLNFIEELLELDVSIALVSCCLIIKALDQRQPH